MTFKEFNETVRAIRPDHRTCVSIDHWEGSPNDGARDSFTLYDIWDATLRKHFTAHTPEGAVAQLLTALEHDRVAQPIEEVGEISESPYLIPGGSTTKYMVLKELSEEDAKKVATKLESRYPTYGDGYWSPEYVSAVYHNQNGAPSISDNDDKVYELLVELGFLGLPGDTNTAT